MLLLDVQGGESAVSLCHDTLSCYLTLPTENKYSVNNGVHVQTGVVRL